MKDNTILLSNLKYIDEETWVAIKNYIIKSTDLYLTIAGTIGAVGEVPVEVDGVNLTENAARLTNIYCIKKYLMYSLLSANSQEHFSSKFHQVAQPKLSIETASATKIPLPSLAEQQRIVSEIERWFKLIDQIEQGKADLQTAITQARNKILDLAIHGKLVPQDPNDEPASELLRRINPKAKITCDNEHYKNLPQGWCRCRLMDLFGIVMGQSPLGNTINESSGKEFHQGKLFFTQKYLSKSNVFTEDPIRISPANSLLLCVRAPVGIVNVSQSEVCIGRGLCSLYPNTCINLLFAYYSISTYQKAFEDKATGTTFKSISKDIITEQILHLPPLAEQQRIVDKIEELFAALNAIEESL